MSAPPVGRGFAVAVAPAPPPARNPTGPSALGLLPSPAAMTDGDAMTALVALECRARAAGRRNGAASVHAARSERARFRLALRAAMRSAARARRKQRGPKKLKAILGKVARVAAVVGSIAAAVATAGAAAPLAAVAIAGAVLSSAGFVVGETKAFDGLMSDKVKARWTVGLSLAGALCSAGAAVGSGLVHGAGAAATAGEGASSAARAASDTNRVVSAVRVAGGATSALGGAATAGAALATIPIANLQHRADQADADAEAALLDAERLRRLIGRVIDELEHMDEAEGRTIEALTGAIRTKNDTTYDLAAGMQWRA